MKKSIKSPKRTKKIAASKDTSKTNPDFKYDLRPFQDPRITLSYVNQIRYDTDVKRETKDFPSEYIKIMNDRLFFFFRDFNATITRLDNEKWEESINRGILKEVAFLKTEQQAFKEKYSISLEDSIKKAQQGDDISIFSLVEWDKAWVAQNFMQKIIAERQAKGDRKFFRKLGNVLSKLPGCMKAVRQHERLLERIKLLSIKNDLKSLKARKQLHKHLDEQGWFDGNKDITPLAVFDVFTRFLKRQEII